MNVQWLVLQSYTAVPTAIQSTCNTLQYSATQHNTTQHNTTQHNTTQHTAKSKLHNPHPGSPWKQAALSAMCTSAGFHSEEEGRRASQALMTAWQQPLLHYPPRSFLHMPPGPTCMEPYVSANKLQTRRMFQTRPHCLRTNRSWLAGRALRDNCH